VVTLVPEAVARCWGMGYVVVDEDLEEVLAMLDHREKGGYARVDVPLVIDGGAGVETAIVYVATPENPNYLGAAALEEIAAQVRRSHGPSGANVEYVLRLAEALAGMGAEDAHVESWPCCGDPSWRRRPEPGLGRGVPGGDPLTVPRPSRWTRQGSAHCRRAGADGVGRRVDGGRGGVIQAALGAGPLSFLSEVPASARLVDAARAGRDEGS
jgi:hypothetical protein